MDLSSGVPTTVALGHHEQIIRLIIRDQGGNERLMGEPRTVILRTGNTGRLGRHSRRRQCFRYARAVRRDAACPVDEQYRVSPTVRRA